MKQLIATIALCAAAIGATAQTTTTATKTKATTTQAASAEKHFTRYLNTEDFKKNVWNYPMSEGKWKYAGQRPCVIDFYATWCGPCRQLAPVLEKVAEAYDGQVDIYKVDVDKEKELAGVFGIRSIPSLLFVPMDTIPVMAQGMIPEENLKLIIDKALLGK